MEMEEMFGDKTKEIGCLADLDSSLVRIVVVKMGVLGMKTGCLDYVWWVVGKIGGVCVGLC
jgi:hypothetical protein